MTQEFNPYLGGYDNAEPPQPPDSWDEDLDAPDDFPEGLHDEDYWAALGVHIDQLVGVDS